MTRWVPANWRGLQWPVFRPLIICGQQSLAVFCVGVFLSFAGHLALITGSGSLMAQIFVSVTGLALMTLVAYYISWSRQQDEPLRMASADARRRGSRAAKFGRNRGLTRVASQRPARPAFHLSKTGT